jgi:MOSC domain-containing protein YiiM
MKSDRAMPLQPLTGTILAVCLGPGGIPKHAVDEIRVRTGGIEGDKQRFRLHGGPNRAVCLFSIEDYRTLQRDGVKAEAPGAFGENVLCEGLDVTQLTSGDTLALGDEVVLEIHDVREPCGTLKPLDARFPNLMLGRSGFVCKVLREGSVRAGMMIRRVSAASSSARE